MKQFKKVYIEITNICNLACRFCPQTKRKPEFMLVETFDKILNQVKPYTDYIYLHVKGEPLLHPELGTLLDLSHAKGFMVNITTNGTRIKETKDILLEKKAVRQINFSLHSFDGNDGMGKKEDYLTDILEFVKEARTSTNILVSLRLWNLNYNSHENSHGNSQLREKNNDLLERIENEFSLPYRIEEKVIPGRGVKLKEGIYLNQEYEFQWPDLKEEEDEGKGYCYGLRNQIAILVDGTVVPCCLDGEGIINLGNIKTTNFNEIVGSEKALKIVEGFSERKVVEELCRKCGYRKKFNN